MLKWALIFFIVSEVAGFHWLHGSIGPGLRQLLNGFLFAALAIFAIFVVLGLLAGEVLF